MSRKLTPDEQALWNRVVAQVEAVEGMDALAPRSKATRSRPRQEPGDGGLSSVTDAASRPAAQTGRGKPSFVDRPNQTSPNMDRRNFQRLVRGKLEIDATLDLHGLRADKAEWRLRAFIRASHAAGHRLLLIITGKGKRTDVDEFNRPRSGVLRTGVPEWLKSGPDAGLILQVTQAHPRHGGGGAYYVYLRRNRPGAR